MRTMLVATACLLMLALAPSSRAWAQSFTLKDGTTMRAERLGYIAKNPKLLGFLQGNKDHHVTIFTSPPFCPSYFFHSSSATAKNPNFQVHLDSCSRAVAARMVDYAEHVRASCRCITFAQGQGITGFRVLVDDEFARDTKLHATATIVERRNNSKSIVRGFVGASMPTGEFRLSNESFTPVCVGKFQIDNGTASASCFRDSIQLTGTYAYQRNDGAGGRYAIGRFQSPDGMRLDFAINLTDQELKSRHPSFPD